MFDLTILKPIALASVLATGAAGTTVAMNAPAAESATAEPAAAPGERAGLGRGVVNRFDPSDEQADALAQIRETRRESARAIRELEPGRERGQARRALNVSTRAAVEALQTDEHGRRPAHAGRRRGPHGRR